MEDSILVIGSMNMDLVVQTDAYPQKGETVTGNNFHQAPGGKGANQALAAGKLGGQVEFIGACGADYFGDQLLESLESGGVKTDSVYRLMESTGVASITVEADGDNRIIVVPGANSKLTPNLIDQYESKIKQAELILLQLEIPVKTVEHIVKLAAKYDTQVLLDPAPVKELSAETYQNIDYLLPNEGELASLVPELETAEQRAEKLLESGVEKLLLTRGEEGVTIYSKQATESYPAIKVNPVDTTAAGDAFAGGFAYGLQQGWSEGQAVEFASAVAALSVTSEGAQPSLPTRKEVKKFRQERSGS